MDRVYNFSAGPSCLPEEVLKAVSDAVGEFVAEAPQFDDLTMLCIRYNGPKQ